MYLAIYLVIMAKIVCKFGGTSLADSKQMKKVRDIVLSSKDRQYVVVSAPGKRFSEDIKITDLLYASIEDDDAFDKVVTRFFSLERDLNVNHVASSYLIANKDFLRQSKDLMASRGEYCSAMVFSEFIGYNFVDASDIITINDDGSINDESYTKIQEILKNNVCYIIPGFYGSTKDGKVKTFSRGGSDITGAIVARGVNATLYENWSDVSGVMTANPRIVENPKIIERLTYDEIETLATYGAEVFHRDAVKPVRDLIPINIKNTNSPSDKGTIIEKKTSSYLPLLSLSIKDGKAYVLGDNKVIYKEEIPSKDDEKRIVNELYNKYFK